MFEQACTFCTAMKSGVTKELSEWGSWPSGTITGNPKWSIHQLLRSEAFFAHTRKPTRSAEENWVYAMQTLRSTVKYHDSQAQLKLYGQCQDLTDDQANLRIWLALAADEAFGSVYNPHTVFRQAARLWNAYNGLASKR